MGALEEAERRHGGLQCGGHSWKSSMVCPSGRSALLVKPCVCHRCNICSCRIYGLNAQGAFLHVWNVFVCACFLLCMLYSFVLPILDLPPLLAIPFCHHNRVAKLRSFVGVCKCTFL